MLTWGRATGKPQRLKSNSSEGSRVTWECGTILVVEGARVDPVLGGVEIKEGVKGIPWSRYSHRMGSSYVLGRISSVWFSC